jgi:hypothetical protein
MLDPRSEIVSRLRKKTGGTGQKKQTWTASKSTSSWPCQQRIGIGWFDAR